MRKATDAVVLAANHVDVFATNGPEILKVIDGFWAGRWASLRHGPNQDLWYDYGRALLKRQGIL